MISIMTVTEALEQGVEVPTVLRGGGDRLHLVVRDGETVAWGPDQESVEQSAKAFR